MDNNYNPQDPMQQPSQQPNGQMNTMAIAALVCGVLAVILSFFSDIYTCILALVLGVVGIVLGAKGMKIAKTTGNGNGLAIGGFVCGIVGTFFAVVMLACAACVLCTAGSVLSGLSSYYY